MTASQQPRVRRRRWLLWVRRIAVGGVAVVALLLLALWRGDLPRHDLEARYAGPPSQFVDIDGWRVHYRDEGQGPVVVLLHGTAASLHTWDGWVDSLTDAFRVIRLDLPGFGLTHRAEAGENLESPDYRAPARLRVIRVLLDRLGVERCAVAGNSLGGFLAWRLALDDPQRVERLVLIDAAGYRFPREGRNVLDLARTPVLKDLLVRLTPRALVARGLRQVYGDPSRLSPQRVDRYYELLLAAGNRTALVQGMMQRSEDLSHRIVDIRQPTLIQWGRLDTWIPPSVGERFHAELPSSRLVIYEDAGHVPMEEIPQRTAADAIAFLRPWAAQEHLAEAASALP